METLHDVVRAGKAPMYGASAMFAWQFQKALHVAETHGWTRFVSMQDHLNLIYREEERELLPLLRREHPDLAVVLTSADPLLAREVACDGEVDILPKPFDLDQMIEMVARAAGAGRAPGER
jgi:1-deoxyxylulose-5-phosphate synthase